MLLQGVSPLEIIFMLSFAGAGYSLYTHEAWRSFLIEEYPAIKFATVTVPAFSVDAYTKFMELDPQVKGTPKVDCY